MVPFSAIPPLGITLGRTMLSDVRIKHRIRETHGPRQLYGYESEGGAQRKQWRAIVNVLAKILSHKILPDYDHLYTRCGSNMKPSVLV